MTDQTSKPNGSTYPFISKAQIAERIETDADFARQCILIIQDRHQRRLAGTAHGPRCGWMSSHASLGPRLAGLVAANEARPEDFKKAITLVARYTKQLAAHFRAEQLQQNPSLAAVADRFGVLPQGFASGAAVSGTTETVATAGSAAPVAPVVPDPPPAESDRTAAYTTDQLVERVIGLLEDNDGLRTEEIAQSLGVSTKELLDPIQVLVLEGRIARRGKARGVRNYLK